MQCQSCSGCKSEPVFPSDTAELHGCAGELLSRLQECACTACPGWLWHAVPVEWGEASRRDRARRWQEELAGPLSWEQRGACSAGGELLGPLAAHESSMGRRSYLYRCASTSGCGCGLQHLQLAAVHLQNWKVQYCIQKVTHLA